MKKKLHNFGLLKQIILDNFITLFYYRFGVFMGKINKLYNYSWFVLFVLAGREEYIKSFIEKNFGELVVFLPKRKIYERKKGKMELKLKKLFPGYLFVSGSINSDIIKELKKVKNVRKFLVNCENKLEPVQKEEMSLIFNLTRDGDTINPSKAYFDQNDKIKIVEGPLKDKEYNIISVDRRRRRIKIELTILGEKREVSLSYDLVKKVE
ncbi:MAG: antiterminator LoaP [Candidatus Mcinerneyibacterium aminivorans]|uniref:Antiterminator LoaP n=1 Tax=Candidatus Mcinerneyibacterium aminivorans TaxID=2703815 RepID=A0A5D0MAT4_9BACT|nr:MAG: antiterminator LoaP [Candidatus Mcinerneyibacterium aminivorans]